MNLQLLTLSASARKKIERLSDNHIRHIKLSFPHPKKSKNPSKFHFRARKKISGLGRIRGLKRRKSKSYKTIKIYLDKQSAL